MTMTSTTSTDTPEGAKRILIVDDEPDIRTFLSMTLEATDYLVTVAEDGLQASQMARHLRPDVIILDVMMPGMDGISVLRGLRADAETADIPVVLLTAKAGDADTWAGWEAGANYYMTKPFDIDHLLDFLESLDGGGPLDAAG